MLNMLSVLQQFHEFFKVKKLALIGQKFLIWNTAEARTQFCAIFNLIFHLQFVLTATDSLSFDRSRVCRMYFTTYLSQDRMFCFFFVQNFLRILRPRFWVCSAVSLALQSAQRAQFELWRDLSWFIRNDVYQKTKVYIRVQNFKFDVLFFILHNIIPVC